MLGFVHCNNVSGVSAFSSWKHKGTKEIIEHSKERDKKKKILFLNFSLLSTLQKIKSERNFCFWIHNYSIQAQHSLCYIESSIT